MKPSEIIERLAETDLIVHFPETDFEVERWSCAACGAWSEEKAHPGPKRHYSSTPPVPPLIEHMAGCVWMEARWAVDLWKAAGLS